jgi:hypothetical protein
MGVGRLTLNTLWWSSLKASYPSNWSLTYNIVRSFLSVSSSLILLAEISIIILLAKFSSSEASTVWKQISLAKTVLICSQIKSHLPKSQSWILLTQSMPPIQTYGQSTSHSAIPLPSSAREITVASASSHPPLLTPRCLPVIIERTRRKAEEIDSVVGKKGRGRGQYMWISTSCGVPGAPHAGTPLLPMSRFANTTGSDCALPHAVPTSSSLCLCWWRLRGWKQSTGPCIPAGAADIHPADTRHLQEDRVV